MDSDPEAPPAKAPLPPAAALTSASDMNDLTLDAMAVLARRDSSSHRSSHRSSPTRTDARASPPRDFKDHKDPKDKDPAAQDSIHASGVASPVPTRTPLATSAPAKMLAARRPLPTSAGGDSGTSAAASNDTSSRPKPAMPRTFTRAFSGTHDKMVPTGEDRKNAGSASNGDRLAIHSNYPSKAFEDEIIVGTKFNDARSSPLPTTTSDQEDVAMDDAGESPQSTHSKRKRSSVQSEPGDDKADRNPSETDSLPSGPRGRPCKSAQTSPSATSARTVRLGYWRDSAVTDGKDRPTVVGFIDSLERLRTRVQYVTQTGELGASGPRVTFERVVFDTHLIGLDHNQIKEYVKIRMVQMATDESPEEVAANEKRAVKEAMRRASAHPVSDSVPSPLIAYGPDLPDYVVNAGRPEKKRRIANALDAGSLPTPDLAPAATTTPAASMHDSQHANGSLAPAGSPSVASAIQRSAIDLLPGTRPTKILLGFWRGSSEEHLEDKHAVYGILGANDMFRVKVTRETRDGRPVIGNFPQGAGALWIHYDEVEFEKHIRHLSRPEVKEYVRVRQRQLDEGERPGERTLNETKAVYDAQARVINAGGAAQSTLGTAGRVDTISFATAANLGREMGRVPESYESKNDMTDRNGVSYQSMSHDSLSRRESSTHDLRHDHRITLDSRDTATSIAAAAVAASTSHMPRTGRHSLPDSAGMSPGDPRNLGRTPLAGHGPSDTGSSNLSADRIERTNSMGHREISLRAELMSNRGEQRAAGRDGGPSSGMSVPSGLMNPILPSQHANGAGNSSAAVSGAGSRQMYNETMGKPSKIWPPPPESSRPRASGDEAKIYMGVKYERKQTGPFQGKLVSPGTILSIDGEDYVEYRVLTKPTFF